MTLNEFAFIYTVAGVLVVGGLVMFTYYEWDYKIVSALKTAVNETFSKLGRELQI